MSVRIEIVTGYGNGVRYLGRLPEGSPVPAKGTWVTLTTPAQGTRRYEVRAIDHWVDYTRTFATAEVRVHVEDI